MNNDRVQELHDRLTEQVEQLVTGDDWAAMLDVAAQFHTYSAGNVMLILAQRPHATRVAGYRAWQALGRQVRKGERGIQILAPCTYRPKRTEQDNAGEGTNRNEPRRLRGFRAATVFDLEQTDGEPLPEVAPELLSGDAPTGLWDAVSSLIEAEGYTVLRLDCSPANGVTRFISRTVTVRPNVGAAQAAKTLTHELAHILLDHGADNPPPRDHAEVEAESVAHIVCAAAGLDSDSYSFPYVARWANGDPAVVKATAERVVSKARRILAGITETRTVTTAA